MSPRTSPPPLPAELNDLVTLHSSFLTALSLYYAHNGTSTPTDLRILIPSITSVWGMRKVTLEDVRLCIGMMSSRAENARMHPFSLSDYSDGKICLELDGEGHISGILARHINEEGLHNLFLENLAYLWQSFRDTQSPDSFTVRPIAQPRRGRGRPKRTSPIQIHVESPIDATTLTTFFSRLPLADITPCSSLSGVAPLKEKGRKRLRDLQESAAERTQSQKKTKASPGKENESAQVQTKITEFATQRKTNLLDRILAKQTLAASLPDGPSPEEQQRKAALQRADEVLGVLSLLAAGRGQQRISFPMTALVQNLQGSMRSPISKEEATKVVEVLANEVAPGYVGVVKMGSMCSVVVNQAMRPLDLRMKLVSLGVEY